MWRIRIKIIRIWKQNTVSGGQSIEMVLVDSSGDKIHATVSNDLVSHYDELLYEDKVPTSHPCLLLSRSTSRGTGFQPVHYRVLLDGTLNTDFLVDVIGQVVEVSPVEIVAVNGKDTEKIACLLRNEE
ncbi:hypothetical protein F2Q69_00020230 [Brassica cretica]|uniref:Replication protein A 70 kDa DNA-binding subunit B/D first OB fold domain-containing protein n=1 Tax=Brassica cretica TaxID=69181 RepID=A0A8S9QC73_BRACR|nr:hypothetical protein F2Q69_00020230 [Brassica cretica]